MRSATALLTLAATVAPGAALTGCAPPQVNTTRLSADDIVTMTDQMAASLSNTPAIAERTPQSERWVWTIDRVENLTEHPMSLGERWLAMARLRASLSESDFARERNISFVIPLEEWRRYARETMDHAAARLIPTHALRATFYSDTLSDAAMRTDAYLCTFRLVDLESAELLWESKFEAKYLLTRNRFD